MWTPSEIRKLFSQICGVILGFAGFYLIVNDIKTTGHINISSSILSGEIESGSAGLLLIFMAIPLVIIPAVFPGYNPVSNEVKSLDLSGEKVDTTKVLKGSVVTIISFVLTMALFVGGGELFSTYDNAAGILVVMGGIITGMVCCWAFISTIVAWFGGIEERIESGVKSPNNSLKIDGPDGPQP